MQVSWNLASQSGPPLTYRLERGMDHSTTALIFMWLTMRHRKMHIHYLLLKGVSTVWRGKILYPGHVFRILADLSGQRGQTQKTFSTWYGLYHLIRMPFGLSNSSATFQRAVHLVLSGSWIPASASFSFRRQHFLAFNKYCGYPSHSGACPDSVWVAFTQEQERVTTISGICQLPLQLRSRYGSHVCTLVSVDWTEGWVEVDWEAHPSNKHVSELRAPLATRC